MKKIIFQKFLFIFFAWAIFLFPQFESLGKENFEEKFKFLEKHRVKILNMVCWKVSLGTTIRQLMELQEYLSANSTEIKEQGESVFYWASALANQVNECYREGGSWAYVRCKRIGCRAVPECCDPECICLRAVQCIPRACQPGGPGIFGGNDSTTCPAGMKEIERLNSEVQKAKERVEKNWQKIEKLKEEINRFREVFKEIEEAFKDWYEKRGKYELFDCYQAKAEGIVKECSREEENNFYICWEEK